MLCEAEFVKRFNKNPIRHCKRCAKAICKVCSENKKQLSITNSEKERVCDECDTHLENYELQYEHKLILAAQSDQIEKMNNQLLELDAKK